jgi:hypothetical protein
VLTDEGLNALTAPEEWVVGFVPMPSNIPVPIRVRRMLKYALRSCELRAVRIRDPLPGEMPNLHDDGCDVWDGRACNCPCGADPDR